MPALRITLRLLLLVAALLNYAAAASAHDHAGSTPPPGEGLCAICVYAGGSLAGAPSPRVLPAMPCWHVAPEASRQQSFVPPFLATCSIRGPPVPA
jgi:hypothetical protein